MPNFTSSPGSISRLEATIPPDYPPCVLPLSLPSFHFPLTYFFFPFHFPRSSEASIINPDVVWPCTSLIPMRAMPGCQKGRESTLGKESKASPSPRHRPPPSSPVLPFGARLRARGLGFARQQILVPGAPGVIFHQDLSPGPRHLAEILIPFLSLALCRFLNARRVRRKNL